MSLNGIRPLIDIAPGPKGTAGDRMTEVQAVELRELCQRLGEPFDGGRTQGQAQMRIDHLRGTLDD